MTQLPAATCPCGTGRTYDVCCQPLHDGRARAETAEQLMRSRYSAYARGRLDHVFRTWHPRTRPEAVDPTPGLMWTGLSVLRTTEGGPSETEGTVTFEAAYDAEGGPGILAETSLFVRHRERWVYLRADESAAP